MSSLSLLQYGFFLPVVSVLVKPLGGYMARVFEGQPTFLDRVLLSIQRLIYRLTGIESGVEMDWKQYSLGFVTAFYNFTTTVAIMIGRFGLAIPALALAGLMAQQLRKQELGNAVPTDGPLFASC